MRKQQHPAVRISLIGWQSVRGTGWTRAGIQVRCGAPLSEAGGLGYAVVHDELWERTAAHEAWLAQAPPSSAPSLSGASLSPKSWSFSRMV